MVDGSWCKVCRCLEQLLLSSVGGSGDTTPCRMNDVTAEDAAPCRMTAVTSGDTTPCRMIGVTLHSVVRLGFGAWGSLLMLYMMVKILHGYWCIWLND